jgi:hypothetical protein
VARFRYTQAGETLPELAAKTGNSVHPGHKFICSAAGAKQAAAELTLF